MKNLVMFVVAFAALFVALSTMNVPFAVTGAVGAGGIMLFAVLMNQGEMESRNNPLNNDEMTKELIRRAFEEHLKGDAEITRAVYKGLEDMHLRIKGVESILAKDLKDQFDGGEAGDPASQKTVSGFGRREK